MAQQETISIPPMTRAAKYYRNHRRACIDKNLEVYYANREEHIARQKKYDDAHREEKRRRDNRYKLLKRESELPDIDL